MSPKSLKPGLAAVMRVVIYTRVSLDRRRKSASVKRQEAESRGVCDTRGWTVAKVFSDNSLSASRFARKEREDYKELITFLTAGEADMLMLWEASRGDRELESWVRLLKLCRTKGILIHIVTHEHTYDMKRPKDFKSLAEEGVDAQYQSEETSLRVSSHMRIAAAAGRPHGKLLYGYAREYDERGYFVRQVENSEQAAVIREAAARVSEGEPCNAVAMDFNSRGIRAPRGGDWDLTQIRRLVTNPAYVAQRVHQGVVVGDGAWPAILQLDVYAVCVKRMTDPVRKSQRDCALKHLLSGVARCGVCGGHMRVQKNRTHYAYLCKNAFHVSVKTTNLEQYVADVVLARMARPDFMTLLTPNSDAASAAKTELGALKGRLEGFYEQAAEGKISPAGLAKLEAKLLPRIAELQRLAQPPTVSPTIRVLASAPDPAIVWEGFTVGVKREVIQILMQVKVHPTRRGARTFDSERVEIAWGMAA